MKKIISILSGLFLFASLNVSAGDFLLNEYNVITIENFTSSGGTHVEGKVFVGGDFIGVDSVGSKLEQGKNIDVLTVAGTMDTATYVYDNNIILSSENNSAFRVGNDADNKTSVNGKEVTTKGNVEQSTDLASIKADYKAQLENSSAYFASLDANSAIEKNGDNNEFAIDSGLTTNDIAVFSLDGSTSIFDLANQNLSMTGDNTADLAYIIINVSGKDVSLSNSSNMNFGTFGPKIIWNFYEAETINLEAQRFAGALLAPYATVTQTGGNIDGSVGVLSLITNAEVHLLTDVDVVTPPSGAGPATEVPEPTTLILMFIAIAGLIYKRKTLNV